EGIIPGGGVSLVRAINAIDVSKLENADQKTGSEILKKALEMPLRQIVENAGHEGAVVLANVQDHKDDYGFDAQADEYGNLYKMGIIDPTKVTRIAVENAASVASLLITTEALVAEKKEPEKAPPMPPGGGMEGMY
ncbi:TCP-1/cpn60 chaperonin family protein, partial [Candidatus Neomarinimicrobiota bacterium]